MRDVHIMVEVELMRSDGNYGRDRAVCQISTTLDHKDDLDFEVQALMDHAAAEAERRLTQSTSLEVRRTMLRKPRLCNECKGPLSDEITGYLHPACDEAQRERYQRQREEQNARWEEERNARELAGVSASRDDDDDDGDEPDDDDEDRPL